MKKLGVALALLVLMPVALKSVLVDRVCGTPVLIEALHSKRSYLHPDGRQLVACITRARHRLSTPSGVVGLATTTLGFLLVGLAFVAAVGGRAAEGRRIRFRR